MNNAKEYLSQIRQKQRVIDRKRERAERLYSTATRTTPVLSDNRASGGNQDKNGAAMDKYMDLLEDIKQDENELDAMQEAAYQLLYQIRNQRYYDVLEMHYLQYMTFEKIGVKMDCSRRWAEKLHGRALEVFDRVLKAQK